VKLDLAALAKKGDPMVDVGTKRTQSWIVGKEHLASAFGSGLVDVLATPVLVGFCEECARTMIDPTLPSGQKTVGTAIAVEHVAATPPGMRVTVIAELVEIDRRRLSFRIEARDEVELVARGTHDRFVIDEARFAAGIAAKQSAPRNA
jgi:fluoroacetyl-CoA thioesterase